jgi:hypothetical protein
VSFGFRFLFYRNRSSTFDHGERTAKSLSICSIWDSLREIVEISSYLSGRLQRSDTAMLTAREYRQFARECTKWAVETDRDEDRKSFLALAKDWTFAAMATDRVEKQEAIR